MADLRFDFSDVDAVFAFDLSKIVAEWNADEKAGTYKGYMIRWSGLRARWDADAYFGWWAAYRVGDECSIVSPIIGPVQHRREYEEVEFTPQEGQIPITGRYTMLDVKIIVKRQVAIALQKLMAEIDDLLHQPPDTAEGGAGPTEEG